MSEQRRTIPKVIKQVAANPADCGLVLGGSVRYGYERDNSDLDFFAISDLELEQDLQGFSVVSDKDWGKLLESRQDAFPIHIAYWTTKAFERLLRTTPHMTFPILDGEVVYDPNRVADRYRKRMRHYFDSRPKL